MNENSRLHNVKWPRRATLPDGRRVLVDFRGQGDDAVITEDDARGLGVAGWVSVGFIVGAVVLMAAVALTSPSDPPNRPALSQENVVIHAGRAGLSAAPALATEE